MGVSGDLLAWIMDFLNARKQLVRIGECLSTPREVTSGVPQGSVLGPILFLIFINDIPDGEAFRSISVKMFADDLKIYSATPPISSSAPGIQRAIDELVNWSKTWQLNRALSKCFVCPVHRRGSSKDLERPKYRIETYELKPTELARDLGVLVDGNLDFKKHIERIIHSASVRLRLISLCFLSKNPYLLKKAFTTYVRPLLEYCSPVWSPRQKYLIDGLE